MRKSFRMRVMSFVFILIVFTESLKTNTTNNVSKVRNMATKVLQTRNLGTDFEINNDLTISLRNRCITAQEDGFLVIYRYYTTGKLCGKKYSNSGALLKPEFTVVNAGTYLYTALFSNNNFIAVYVNNLASVYGKIYNSNIEEVKSEFLVGSLNFKDLPHVCVLTSGGYVISYKYSPTSSNVSIQAVVYDQIGNVIKSEFKVIQANSVSRLSALLNGGFVITWIGTDTKVHAQIYDQIGNVVKSDFIVSSTLVCIYPDVKLLSSGNFVIAWSGQVSTTSPSGCDVYHAILNTNGDSIFPETIANSITTNDQTEVIVQASLSYEWYLITWLSKESGSYNKIYSKKFLNNGSVYKNEVQINSGMAQVKSQIQSGFLKGNGNCLFTWAEGNTSLPSDIYGNIITNANPTCNGFSMKVASDAVLSIDFTNYINDSEDNISFLKIQIQSIPSSGYLTSSETNIKAGDIILSSNVIKYTNSVAGTYTFIFGSIDFVQAKSIPCTVTLLVCYATCSTCSADGDDTNNNCLTCKTGFFSKSDVPGNCYNNTPEFYYLSSALNKLMPCYAICSTCSAAGDDTNNNCLTCKTGYYLKSDEITGNCYNNTPEFYYLSSALNKLMPCYATCSTCSADGDDTNNNCLACETGYYSKSDAPGNCYNKAPEFYYLSSALNKLMPCYAICSTCSEVGVNLNNKCSTCKTGYYLKSDEITGNCYNNTPEFYYLSSALNKLMPCYKNCGTCSADGDDTNNNCLTCKTGYRIKSDETTGNCYYTLPFNYYLNNPNNTYVPCSNIDSLDTKTETIKLISFSQNTKEALVQISFKIKLSKNFYDEFLSRQINEAYVIKSDDDNNNSKIYFAIDTFQCEELSIHNDGGLNGGSYIFNLIDGVGNLIKSTNNFYINDKVEPVLNNTSTEINNSTSTLSDDSASDITSSMIEKITTNTTSEEIQKAISLLLKTRNYTSATIKEPIVLKTNTTTIQISSTTNESLALERKYSIENKLSLVTFDECEKVLKSHYNIPDEEELIYSKIDYSPDESKGNNTDGNSESSLVNNAGLSIFDGEGNPLDLSLCENTTITYQFATSLNLTNAKDIASLGYDIYNPEDKLYNDFCVSFSNNDSDFTVNNRRNEIYPNVTIGCSGGCTYSGMDYEINYVKCDCKGSTTESVMDYLDGALNDLFQSNFIVITCLFKVFQGDIFSNYGFIMVLCAFTVSILLSTVVGFVYVILKPENLTNILKFDAEFFEPEEEKAEDEENEEENKGNKEEAPNSEFNQREEQELNINADIVPHVGNPFKNNLKNYNPNNIEIKETLREYELTNVNPVILNSNDSNLYSSTRRINNFISDLDNERKNHNSRPFKTYANLDFNKDEQFNNNHVKYKNNNFETCATGNEKRENLNFPVIRPLDPLDIYYKNEIKKCDEKIKKFKKGVYFNNNLSGSYSYLNNDKDNNESEDFLNKKKPITFIKENENLNLKSNDEEVSRYPYAIYYSSKKRNKINSISKDVNSVTIFNKNISKEKTLEDEDSKISYSLRDFDNMKFAQILEYDKRTFWYVYWDTLVEGHDLISLFLKKSLVIPYPIRIFNFFFAMCLDFTINAIFYTDDYISNRHTTAEDTGFFYTFIHELPKSLWASLISAIISNLLEKLIEPSKKIEKEFNDSLVTKDLEQIKSG